MNVERFLELIKFLLLEFHYVWARVLSFANNIVCSIVSIKSSSLDFIQFFSMILRSDRSSNFVHKRVRYICSNIDLVVWRILYDTFVSTSVPYTLRVISILTLASLADKIEVSIEWVSYIRINNKFIGVILFRITFSLRGLQVQKDHRF